MVPAPQLDEPHPSERAPSAAVVLVVDLDPQRTGVILAAYPASQFGNFLYLEAFLAPVGMVAWLTLVWTAVEVAAVALRRISLLSTDRLRTVRAGALVGGVGLVVAVCSLTIATAAPLVSGDAPTLAPPGVTQATTEAAAKVARHAPGSSFVLFVQAPTAVDALAVSQGVGYQLRTQGFRPRLTGVALSGVGSDALATRRLPIVIIHLALAAKRSSGALQVLASRISISRARAGG